MAKGMKKGGGRAMVAMNMKRKGMGGVSKKKKGGLKGKQSKLDMNRNGRIDGEDFKLLRKKKGGKK